MFTARRSETAEQFPSIKKAAMPLPAGEAEEAQAEFISAVAAGLGAEPHLSDGNCGAVSWNTKNSLTLIHFIVQKPAH